MIEVQVSVVGVIDPPEVKWPQGWPIPRIGEEVFLPNQPSLFVRVVEWYPMGDPENDEMKIPFVYVVIGPRLYDQFGKRV